MIQFTFIIYIIIMRLIVMSCTLSYGNWSELSRSRKHLSWYNWAGYLAVALTGYSCTSSGLATVFFQLHLQNLLHRWDYHYYLPWTKRMMMAMTMMATRTISWIIKSIMMMVMMTMPSKRMWSPDDGVKMVALTSIQYGPLVDNHIGFWCSWYLV